MLGGKRSYILTHNILMKVTITKLSKSKKMKLFPEKEREILEGIVGLLISVVVCLLTQIILLSRIVELLEKL